MFNLMKETSMFQSALHSISPVKPGADSPRYCNKDVYSGRTRDYLHHQFELAIKKWIDRLPVSAEMARARHVAATFSSAVHDQYSGNRDLGTGGLDLHDMELMVSLARQVKADVFNNTVRLAMSDHDHSDGAFQQKPEMISLVEATLALIRAIKPVIEEFQGFCDRTANERSA
jgi:hypothetical protein